MLDILAAFSQYLILVFLSGFIELLAMAWVTNGDIIATELAAAGSLAHYESN